MYGVGVAVGLPAIDVCAPWLRTGLGSLARSRPDTTMTRRPTGRRSLLARRSVTTVDSKCLTFVQHWPAINRLWVYNECGLPSPLAAAVVVTRFHDCIREAHLSSKCMA